MCIIVLDFQTFGMRHIANILTNDPFDEWELYNIVNEPDKLEKGIPTLIVVWDNVKSLYPEASIIEWKVTDNVYWTYGKYERREKYEENTKKFQDMASRKCIESVGYKFYDVILLGPGKFGSFLKMLGDGTRKWIYASNDVLYVYIEGQSCVLGVSLRDCDYVDEDYKKRIFSVAYGNSSVTVLKNNDAISRETRYRIRGNTYMIPYLFSSADDCVVLEK